MIPGALNPRKVQHRARVADVGEAVRVARVVLQKLAARVPPGERKDLAAQLPQEVAYYLDQVSTSDSFDLQTLYDRIGKAEGVWISRLPRSMPRPLDQCCAKLSARAKPTR